MPKSDETFSESWYRIANQKISLRPGIVVRKQSYRGERWVVLENPFNNQYFRIRPEAYEFVARLHPDRTVEQVWEECLERFPETAPGQVAVIRLLSQLYLSNLLQYHLAADSRQLFERFKKRRGKEMRAKMLSIMFVRIPLYDPDAMLNASIGIVGKLISKAGALFWLLAIGWALKLIAENFSALSDESQSVLSPDNLFLLYGGLIITKTLHEFGHAYACKRFGGEVHTMGVMLLIFTPLPYVDATSSWGFRSRWQRILVASAGMIVEVFIAAIATYVWFYTSPGTVHNLCFNMMFVASVSTVLFNLNPLLRFDGYYILSDLLEIPNLHQRSANQLKHFFKRYLFGVKKSESPARSGRERFWLVTFGILSNIYRIVVFSGILLFVADRFLLLGIIMAVVCLVGWIVAPVTKFLRFLASDPSLDRTRPRAVGVTCLLVGGILAFLQFVPFPTHFRAPGVLQAEERAEVITEVSGTVREVFVPSGTEVKKGDRLVRLSNEELGIQMRGAMASLEEVDGRIRQAMREEPGLLKPLAQQRKSVAKLVTRMQREIELQTLRARIDGIWVAPRLQDYSGRFVVRGTPLGMVIDPARFEFSATVPQTEADRLFKSKLDDVELRLHGEEGRVLQLSEVKRIPGDRRNLPSPALSWRAGGEVMTDASDPEGRLAAESFFEVRGHLEDIASIAAYHGRTGTVRFYVGNEALLPGWMRSLRQLLQKRYQL